MLVVTEERYLGVILQSNLESDITMAATGITISKREKDFYYPKDLTVQIIHDLDKFED